MKKKFFAMMLAIVFVCTTFSACNNKTEEKKSATKTEEQAKPAKNEESKEKEEKVSKVYKNTAKMSDFDQANEKDALKVIKGEDTSTLLIDARTQESFSGWKLEGAKNGGHLKNALLFSSRWLDCEYSEKAPRDAYLDRAAKDQGIEKDKNIIIYDYQGKQSAFVADYLKNKGFNNIKVLKADKLIDDANNVESNKNFDMFIPSEIVKNISDYKTGKTKELSEDAKSIVGDSIDKVVLVDVGWGNAKASSYFSQGHVPGAVHINTDSYERPRVYVPEKRSDYAKEWRLISLEQFRDELCPQYGINKDSIVIVSGTQNSPQARIGFMLRSLGVKVYAMSGNLTAWKYNGYELDKDENTLVVPNSIDDFGTKEIENPDEILWTNDIKDILTGKKDGQVADNRGKKEFEGTYTGYNYHDLAGKIENSIWCPQYSETEGMYFENIDNTARTQNELLKHMKDYNLDTSKTVAFFCGDSWGAARIAYICQSTGIETIKQWGNGWIPWSNLGNEFIDHTGKKVHYDKYRDTVVDEKGNDVRDGVNILDDKKQK